MGASGKLSNSLAWKRLKLMKLQHLGRAKEVSEYVKHGCQEATIEIELAKDGKQFKKNVVIRCTIKREGNKSFFTVDGRPSSKKAVVELARSLSIQIDNLCQFLPQDKVVEFAAMSPVELLRSTQRAVATQEMIDIHEELKDYGKKRREVLAKSQAEADTLANLEGRQRLQEADVERMREREQTVKRVEMLEASRPFAQYRQARLVNKEASAKKKDAQTELKTLQDEVEPALRAVNAKQQYQKSIELVAKERKNAVTKAETHADKIDRSFVTLHDKSVELAHSVEAEKKSGKKHKSDVVRIEGNINRLKLQLEEPPAQLDVAGYNERIVSFLLVSKVVITLIDCSERSNATWTIVKGRYTAVKINNGNLPNRVEGRTSKLQMLSTV